MCESVFSLVSWIALSHHMLLIVSAAETVFFGISVISRSSPPHQNRVTRSPQLFYFHSISTSCSCHLAARSKQTDKNGTGLCPSLHCKDERQLYFVVSQYLFFTFSPCLCSCSLGQPLFKKNHIFESVSKNRPDHFLLCGF